jgi:hypothetical protein
MVNPSELSKNNVANAIPNLEKRLSMPLAFVLPKNCSPAPAIEPDKPALLPDCKRTVEISPMELIIRIIIIAIVMISPPSSP